METKTKDEVQDVITFTLRISKKQIRLLRIMLSITAFAGVAVFFLKHF